ncbi:MFS transporter, partial [Streptomyces sp. NPDC052015]
YGAVFGPWLGGQLVASKAEGWGFTAFAVAAVLATVFVSLTGLRSPRRTQGSTAPQRLSTTG